MSEQEFIVYVYSSRLLTSTRGMSLSSNATIDGGDVQEEEIPHYENLKHIVQTHTKSSHDDATLTYIR